MGLPKLNSIKFAITETEFEMSDIQQLMVSQTLLSGDKSKYEKVLGAITVGSAVIKLGRAITSMKNTYDDHSRRVQLYNFVVPISDYESDILEECLGSLVGKYNTENEESYNFRVVDGEPVVVMPEHVTLSYRGKLIFISKMTSENRNGSEVVTGYSFRSEDKDALGAFSAEMEKHYHKTFDARMDDHTPAIFHWDAGVRDSRFKGRLKGDKNKTLFLREGQKEALHKAIDDFQDNESSYYDLGVPYKMGICLYGPPGTGKTSTIRAIAQYANRAVYYISLNSLENDQMLVEAMGMANGKLVVFEDIDIISASNSGSKDNGAGITRQGLLNVLDGVNSPDDAIIVMTTNNREILDEALTRSGRVDLEMKLDYIDQYQLDSILEFLNVEQKIVLPEGVNVTGSDIMGIVRNYIRERHLSGPAIQEFISGKEAAINEVTKLGFTV